MNEEHARFTHMRDSTAEDWALINRELTRFKQTHVDRIIAHLRAMEGDYGGFPVDRLTHSTQSATRALNSGEDEEYVVCALLHDIGDALGVYNHPDVAATILQPFVSEANYWMVKHHGIFQGYHFFHHFGLDRHMREQFRDHPHYARTVRFVERYDAAAFDPDYPTLPLEAFEPMLRNVFSTPKNTLYAAMDNNGR